MTLYTLIDCSVEGTVNCTDENLHDEQKGAATSSSMSTISLKETMLSDNKTSHVSIATWMYSYTACVYDCV